MPQPEKLIIGVVGPCGAGKSTLVKGLTEHGYTARHIAQEHSYVGMMWKRIVNPDLLVYLDVSFPVSTKRRNLEWILSDYEEQLRRLKQAREHAEIVIDTNELTPEMILKIVLTEINKLGV
jgi:deoxyadenosine/deoxycytidine kinase